MLNLICGSAGSGKSRLIYNKISALAKEGKKSLLIVPESMSHLAERRLLSSCGNSVSRYAKVTTLSHLTSDIFFTCGLTDKYLDNGGRVLSMYRAIHQLEGRLSYYGSEVSRPALVSSMLDITNEFIHSGVSDSELTKLAATLSPKIQDISLIYTSYLSVCRESSLDPAVAMDIASQHISESRLFLDTHVFFDDFTAYSEQKMRFIEHIIADSEEVTFSILTNGDPIVFYEQHKLRSRLCDMVSRRGEEPNVIDLPRPTEGKAGELLALENLFMPNPPVFNGEISAIELFSAENMAEECELIAAKIRWLTLKQGARLRDIAVVCGNETDYTPLLESAFEKYNIPCFFSRKEDVLKKPAFAAALGPLSCLCDGLRLETVLEYIKCGLLGLDEDKLCKLENYALMWDINGKAWLEPFTKSTNGYGDVLFHNEKLLQEIEDTRLKAVKNIILLKNLTNGCKSGKELNLAFSEYIKQADLRRLFETRMKVLNDNGRHQDAAEYAQLYEILVTALAQFEAVCGEMPMSIDEFKHLLNLTLSQYDVSSIPTYLDSVTVGTFARMASYGIKHLIIIGARYGALPPEVPSGSILSENERDALSLPSNEDKTLSIQADIYRAFNTPNKSLTVVYPKSSDGEDVFFKSHIVTYMEKILPKLKEQAAADSLAYLRLIAPRPAYELACSATENPDTTVKPTPVAIAARSRLSKNPEKLEKFKFLEKYNKNPREVITNIDVLRGLYNDRLSVSASAMDKYYACPFMHFCQYGLSAEKRKVAQFSALEIGSFVHAVVENAIKELTLSKKNNPNAPVDIDGVARHFADIEIAKQKDADNPRIKTLLEQFKENAVFITHDVWEEIQCSDFKPQWFEMNVGFGGDVEPTTWKENGFDVILKGKIDRVDKNGNYLKVIDYKTGKKEFALSDVVHGINLQLFIYMIMLKKANIGENCAALYIPAKADYLTSNVPLSEEEAKAKRRKNVARQGLIRSEAEILNALEHGCTSSPARWLPLSYDKKNVLKLDDSRVASKDQLERITNFAEGKIKEYAKRVTSGDISIEPYGEKTCDWCDFKSVCFSAREGEKIYSTYKTSTVLKMMEESENEQNGL